MHLRGLLYNSYLLIKWMISLKLFRLFIDNISEDQKHQRAPIG